MSPIRIEHPPIALEDALARTSRWLRDHHATWARNHPTDMFQFCVRSVIQDALSEILDEYKRLHPPVGMTAYEYDLATNTATYVQAVWQLCRRGILSPAMKVTRDRGLSFPGDEFTLTDYGENWLRVAPDVALPTEYGRFAGFLASHASRFRPSYHLRSQEALACYRAGLYLSCCTMCGAAAEAIILSLAIAKVGDERGVLRDYQSSGGLGRIRRQLAAQQNSRVHEAIDQFSELLKYWRDEAAHAGEMRIDEEHAFLALLLLLRLARFADERWDEIKGGGHVA
jgi:hypothetical protein